MKPNDVDAIPAGPELDLLVGQKVMGWEPRNFGLLWDPIAKLVRYPQGLQDVRAKMGLEGEEPSLFVPSKDIRNAWEVIEKMRTYRKEPGRFATPTPIYTLFVMAVDQDARPKDSHGTTLYDVLATIDPAMICRAAVKAVLWAEQETKQIEKERATA